MRARATVAAALTSIVTAVLGLAAAVPANAAPVDVPAAAVARLRAVGVPVAIPGYVPAGFRLVRVEATPCPRVAERRRSACAFGPNYALHYAKSSRSAFVVEETGGGIGDTGDDFRTTVGTALFGPVTLYFGTGLHGFGAMKPAPPALVRTSQPHLISEWAGRGPFYHLIGEAMTPADAAKVLASLHWLR